VENAAIGNLSDLDTYPGYALDSFEAPWVSDYLRPMSAADEGRFWFLDFHFPRGHTPMGLTYVADGYAWGSQLAAETLPLPPGRGLAPRLAATHLYGGELPVTSPAELESRAARLASNLRPFLDHFSTIWAARVAELERELHRFETAKLDGFSPGQLGQRAADARTFQRRAWEIHFEVMYPLLANYLGFRRLCRELGIDTGLISIFLQGEDTRILACDRGLWQLATDADELGLGDLLRANEPEQIAGALEHSDSANASAWRARFAAFLDEFGHRTEGIADIALPSWIEDPTSPLGTIRSYLQAPSAHDFVAARGAAVDEREAALDGARSSLTVEEQRAFDAALASSQRANFAWWNDEHNHYIDLRATLPLRRACLAIGAATGAARADDTLFLFWPELMELCAGRQSWASLGARVGERRDFYRYWRDRRPVMPKLFGAIPERVDDPILIEIFGLHHGFLASARAGGEATEEMVGVAASAGVARGRARVLHSADELHRIGVGKVLVCEATSPNWTPAFSKIAACVCDGGGALTHASIISREYRIPCVVGVGLGTRVIRDGDLVEVDGGRGRVTILQRAAAGD